MAKVAATRGLTKCATSVARRSLRSVCSVFSSDFLAFGHFYYRSINWSCFHQFAQFASIIFSLIPVVKTLQGLTLHLFVDWKQFFIWSPGKIKKYQFSSTVPKRWFGEVQCDLFYLEKAGFVLGYQLQGLWMLCVLSLWYFKSSFLFSINPITSRVFDTF